MKLFTQQDPDHDSVIVGIRYNVNGQERIIKKHLSREAQEKIAPERIKNELLHMAEADRRKSMATGGGPQYGLGVAGLAAGLANSYPTQQDAMQTAMTNYTKMLYTNGTNTVGSWKMDDMWTDAATNIPNEVYTQLNTESLIRAKQMMQGSRRFKFPALNGFSTYDEGSEVKGVDLLRHRCAKWLGTVVAS